ncbi:class I SAM-dependent methyltransferase [Streptomyces bohaiensis]|uniref:Class I SAM-dependent methyltransferase n=1 Tax=Streptomyces bohaiensis TaxID=1431344 RepID=A0ABX1C4D3_9ACTN|nr:class I SAM-dependent methyltransferase [Streptomyces bohaiensis]NJQ14072.1 class I SAM-dependent methyltransferase [Streptomyces bohaiensis]
MTSPLPHSAYARSFDAVATEYAASRPSYPPELFELIESHIGRPLAETEILDVGAGTGIASQLLNQHGARVTAVEPSEPMASQLNIAHPGLPLVRADGDALPFADRRFDLVTYAQSWHWTEPRRSVPEALRVLRPGGALALWWNVPDQEKEWVRAQAERLSAAAPDHGLSDVPENAASIIESLGLGLEPVRGELRWTRSVPVDTHLDNLATHSTLSVLPPGDRTPLIDAEREAVCAEFPDGIVAEEYIVRLTLVRAPDA